MMGQTVADLEQSQEVGETYLDEALQVGESVDIAEICHDCGASVRIRATREDERSFRFDPCDNNAVYKPAPDGENSALFFKCAECYQKDSVLRGWRDTQVYTRVVGYYQPVDKFNVGKREEFRKRQNFAM